MEFQQIRCQDDDNAVATVYVEAHRVKRGNVVTFKETGERRWMVREVYPTIVRGINRGWGLDLPKSQRTER